MEFRFNLNELFQEPIIEIGSNLVPPGFQGDKRALWDTQSKVTQIVNAMGEASASAQGLSKPITTADRLRNSEHKLYLLLDQSANSGKGAVTGMLKTGEKGLYVFDREGQHYQVSPPCVLDFYIHESRQRSGYGKSLFEHMLQKQKIEPVKMAIDRPSDKLLGFLNKHYSLNMPVKQMNNYVVYDGFFPRPSEAPRTLDADKSYTLGKKQSANGLQHGIPSSPYGRYGAPRPPCSMGQIIHNDSAVIKRNQEPTGVRSEPYTNASGQYIVHNSNQLPAWQATQSVPNMSYANNQQNYAQSAQQCFPNQQYVQNPQYQQLAPNQNARYPPSSGDYNINATPQQMGQALVQNQAQAAPQGQPQDQTANQNYQQGYYNYSIGQGDATNQSYKDRHVVTSTVQQNQGQYQQVSGQNEAQANQNHNMRQDQLQVFTYQGQNYCFNPQTQQYQLIPDQYQPSLSPDVPQQQQYYNQMPVQASISKSNLAVQKTIPRPQKEPLRPQNFDGTVRTVQQSASMPMQRTGTEARHNMPTRVHETASAPVSYQHQLVAGNQQGMPGLGNAHTPPVPQQASNQNEYNSQVTHHNQMVAPATYQPQYQPSSQANDQNLGTIPFTNTDSVGQAPQGAMPTPATANQMMVQAPNVNPMLVNAPQSTMPRPATAHQMMVQAPNVSPMLANQVQNVQQIPSMPAASVPNAQNEQQTMGNTQMPAENQVNPQMTYHNQPISEGFNSPPDGNQTMTTENSSPVAQSTSSRTNNVVSSPPTPQMHFGNTTQVMTPPHNENLNNQMIIQNQQHQYSPAVSAMAQAQNVHGQQQNIIQQYPQPVGNANQNVAWQQPGESRGLRQMAAQPVASNVNEGTRYIGDNNEVDLSKGYPPQHHEKPAQHSTPRADRPSSLNIEHAAEDLELKKNDLNEDNAELHELDGDHGDIDSLDEEATYLEAIEDEIGKIDVAPREMGTPASKGSKSPGIEAAGIVTPGRNTPGLTEQGYFDLKFYHNKLW